MRFLWCCKIYSVIDKDTFFLLMKIFCRGDLLLTWNLNESKQQPALLYFEIRHLMSEIDDFYHKKNAKEYCKRLGSLLYLKLLIVIQRWKFPYRAP